MISHRHARQLLEALSGDPETVAALVRYVEHQASLERVDAPSVARLADAAERRSCEAVARVKTLTDDLGQARTRIAALEAQGDALEAALVELAAMIDARQP